MTSNHRGFHGELLPPEVIRKGIYELGKVNRVPPEVGIFDSPTRCFVVNQEWWSHIAGMVHLLADVVSWKDAEDESYFAIQEILRFMQGMECMEFLLRQNPEDDCLLEQTLDGGETWTTAFNFSICLVNHTATIEAQLSSIEMQNIINSGYSPTETTTSDVYSDDQLSDASVEADVCDTDGKDAIYGAVSQLVNYIHAKNLDFLQNVAQGANAAEQLKRLISGTPVVGLLPGDEAVEYVGFLVDELNGEYLATVTEELLQEVKCELFCQAVNSNCVFNLGDVFNFFSSHVSPDLATVSNTLSNLIQFALSGTFTGDEYYYFMSWFQMSIAGAKQRFLDIASVAAYEQQMAAGFNSPDNDWSIFCDACPAQYRLWTHDFASGMGEFSIPIVSNQAAGFLTGGRIKGIDFGANKSLQLTMPFDPTWRVRGAKLYLQRDNGVANGTNDVDVFKMRPIPNSDAGSFNPIQGGFRPNGVQERCDYKVTSPFYFTDANQIWIACSVTDNATSNIYLDKVEILFEMAYAKPGSVVTLDDNICT